MKVKAARKILLRQKKSKKDFVYPTPRLVANNH